MKKERLLKIIALILCAAMMMCVFSACQDTIDDPDDKNTDDENEEEVNDFTTLYRHFDPETPVMTIGDVEISWGTLYYYFYQEATTLYSNQGEIYDWTAEYTDGLTYIEYCVSEAVYNSLRRLAGIQHFAKEYNVELTDEQLEEIGLDKTYDESLFESEEAMQEYLASMYLDTATVELIAESEYLYLDVMDAAVGENGEKLTVDEITALADTAYKMIKIVPFEKTDSGYKNAEAALAEVKAATDTEAKFDELIDIYADASKVDELKAGYVFTRGYFDEDAVEDVLREMEKGNYYDGIVEGEEGYYLVLRTAVDVDAYPYYGAEKGFGESTLRVLYRDDIFEDEFWAWADYAEVTAYENMAEMDIEEVLGWK